MIRRNTQTSDYWETLNVTDEDLEQLSNVLVDQEIPLALEELVAALVSLRCQAEESRIARELARGTPYLPKNSVQVGEQVVFPLFEYALGTVVGVREGRNPEYGQFDVARVEFAGGRKREFAVNLANHPLNDVLEVVDETVLSPEALVERYGAHVRAALGARLEAETAFIRLAGKWFLKDLLAHINQGHLNIAEAALDMAGGGPLPTEALLDQLDVFKEVRRELSIFSLNYALQEDERFDEVGPAGEVLWYLRRLEPAPVLDPPKQLQPKVVEYDHRLLDETMLNLQRRLDDEWSEMVAPPVEEEPITVILTCPHRRSGTLPLSSRIAHVFPTGRTHRIRFTFRDAATGDEMQGWVVRERRFVYGLKEWYEKHQLPIGAYLEVSRGRVPGEVLIRRRATRVRRDWVRVAVVSDAQLSFEMGRFPLSCETDDLMVIAIDGLESLDLVSERARARRLSLKDIVAEVLPELAKLSPQGMVHAATLYSAVNMIVRTPPGPLLATLVSDDRYMAMGDNYWAVRRSYGLGDR